MSRVPRLALTPATVLCLLALAFPVLADSASGWDSHRADSHAPIGVMGDHTHKTGEMMLSYRYMSMHMNGNRDGTERLSPADLFADGYMMAPLAMEMEMHMLGGMYAPSDRITLMAMLPWVSKQMEMVTRMGMAFSNETDGVGDIKAGATIVLAENSASRWLLNTALSAPTGSIDERGTTPMGPNRKLAYGMQLGSGTWDLQPGVTWLGQSGRWSAGAQVGATVRTGENDEGYRLGNEYRLTGWVARSWTDGISTSVRLNARERDRTHGADAELNPMMAPGADARLSGGQQVDLLVGLNLYRTEGMLQGHRLAVEVGNRVYADLNGPQMEADWSVTTGWQYSW